MRKPLLALHLVLSVGWIGAVLAYIALDLVVATGDAQAVHSAYSMLGVVGVWVIEPLALGTLLSGILLSLATKWGLVEHYWVLISLVLTMFAFVVLFEHMPGIASGKNGAMRPDFQHSVGGLIVLLVVAVLNVYKPRGLTSIGWRRRVAARRA